MSVQSRIKQTLACEVINLNEVEKDIYCGAGWKLARFDSEKLVEFFDPSECNYSSFDDLLADAISWLKNRELHT